MEYKHYETREEYEKRREEAKLSKIKPKENEVIYEFEKKALDKGYSPDMIYKTQNKRNRITDNAEGTYFQFGDLRVETNRYHLIVETENAGGTDNLIKYWYLLTKKETRRQIDRFGKGKPIKLIHLYHQTSEKDYLCSLNIWRFNWNKMQKELPSSIDASLHTFKRIGDTEFKKALEEFEKHLK